MNEFDGRNGNGYQPLPLKKHDKQIDNWRDIALYNAETINKLIDENVRLIVENKRLQGELDAINTSRMEPISFGVYKLGNE